MKNRQKILLNIVAAVITFLVIYAIISVFIIDDYLYSLVPGWHKTLYTLPKTLRLTIMISASAIIAYVLFRAVSKAFSYVWGKVFTKG